MGKTTNTLITAGDFALQGQIFVDSLRTMYRKTHQKSVDVYSSMFNVPVFFKAYIYRDGVGFGPRGDRIPR